MRNIFQHHFREVTKMVDGTIDILSDINYNDIEPLKLRMRRRWCFLFRINYKSIMIIRICF